MVKRAPHTPLGLRILTSTDVDQILDSLDPEAALQSQADVFTAFSSTPSASEGPAAVQTPHRISVFSQDQIMLFMPSRAAFAGGTGIKIVGLPSKGSEGLAATTVLLDETSGKVRALINARKLTALRNACGSALFLRALPAPRDPTSFLIFGSGAQALSHAILFLRLWPSISTVTFIIRRSTPRSASLMTTLRHMFPSISFHIGVSDFASQTDTSSEVPPDLQINLSQAVHNANIILTATSSRSPLFNSVDVTSGTHVIMVGSYTPEMHEVDSNLIRRAGHVVVDSREATAQEAGELIKAGVGKEDVVELGELLHDEEARSKVTKAGDINIFKSVGVGIQDVAIANLILHEAERLDLGIVVPDFD